MTKYGQDKDEQLQRFRNAMQQRSWWTDQLKTSKIIDSAWKIADTEFADLRKLMDDSKSFTHSSTIIACYLKDVEDDGCPVLESSEAALLMSQLLSKLTLKDNSDFDKEMKTERNQVKKQSETSSPGYIRKQVFALETNGSFVRRGPCNAALWMEH